MEKFAMLREHLTEEEFHKFIEIEPILNIWDKLTTEEKDKYQDDEELKRMTQKVYDVATAFHNGEITYNVTEPKRQTT